MLVKHGGFDNLKAVINSCSPENIWGSNAWKVWGPFSITKSNFPIFQIMVHLYFTLFGSNIQNLFIF